MRALKGFLVVLAGLFLVITLISFLIPGRVTVKRAVPMHGDSLKIFNQISDLKNWRNWQPVFIQDSAGIQLSPVTDSAGSFAEWMSNGRMNRLVILKKKYPLVEILLQRAGSDDVTNALSVVPVQEEGNFEVQWEAVTMLKWYPWQKFGGIFIEKLSGPGYEAALQSLANYINAR